VIAATARSRARAASACALPLCVPLCVALCVASARADKPATPSTVPPPAKNLGAERYLTKGAPVRIRSQKMAVFNKENRAVFTGQVVAIQGDLILRCHELVARYKAGGGLAGLVASGGVRVRKGKRRATGQQLQYDHDRRVMELSGAPRLFEKDSFVEGERILFHLDEDRVDVERPRGRLRVEEEPR
jgi:lipopolysaccharide export system protein LptA